MSPLERRISDLEQAFGARNLVRVVPGHLTDPERDAWCAADRARTAYAGVRIIQIHTGVPRHPEAA